MQQKEEGDSDSQERVELVKELSKRAIGKKLCFWVMMGNRSFRVTPSSGFFCKGMNNNEHFLIKKAIDFAKRENCFSSLLSAFLKGKTEIEIEVR